MEFNKCTRCGCFYITDGDTCPSCKTKDDIEIAKLNNFFAESENTSVGVGELSYITGISVKNLSRYANTKNLNFKKKIIL